MSLEKTAVGQEGIGKHVMVDRNKVMTMLWVGQKSISVETEGKH